jgi:hypothetical protein
VKRVRQVGLFQGWQELDPDQLDLPMWPQFGPQTPMPDDPTFDPLSDPLDEPFPEERS